MEENLARALAQLQIDWQLSEEQMARLCHLGLSDYQQAIRAAREPDAPTLPRGLEHGMTLVSIHRRLALHFPDPVDQVKWMTTPNRDFDQNRPMDVALSSPGNQAWLAYYLSSFAEKPQDPEGDSDEE
jgi:hypothetical protein